MHELAAYLGAPATVTLVGARRAALPPSNGVANSGEQHQQVVVLLGIVHNIVPAAVPGALLSESLPLLLVPLLIMFATQEVNGLDG